MAIAPSRACSGRPQPSGWLVRSAVALGCVLILSGCVVYPAGPGYYGPRPAYYYYGGYGGYYGHPYWR